MNVETTVIASAGPTNLLVIEQRANKALSNSRKAYLEILATDEASVHIDGAERDRAAFLEIEIQVLRHKQSSETHTLFEDTDEGQIS